jgi:hypothetical protein
MLVNYKEFHTFTDISDHTPRASEEVWRVLSDLLKHRKKSDIIRILDIGSSDGSVMEPVLAELHKMGIVVRYVAVEPEKEAYEKALTQECLSYIDGELHNCKFEDYMQHNVEQFDYIAFSHSFYHFEFKDWRGIVEKSLEFLNDDGKLHIILDSEQGAVYELMPLVTNNKLDTDTKEFGFLHFAEDMESFLRHKGMEFEQNTYLETIRISKNDRSVDEAARILAFLFRRNKTVLNEYFSNAIKAFLYRHQGVRDYSLINKVNSFIITK